MKRITRVVSFAGIIQHHAPMIHTHRDTRTFFLKNTDQLYHMSTPSQMRCFYKIPVGKCIGTAQMYKMSAVCKHTCQQRYVVMQSGAERTGTECQPVMRVINRMEKPVDIFLTGHNTRHLMALEDIPADTVEQAQAFIDAGKMAEEVVQGTPSMWARVTLSGGGHTVSCTVARKHDHVERLVADGAVLVDQPLEAQSGGTDWTDELTAMHFEELWNLALGIDDAIVRQMLEGARMNMAILDHAGTEQAGIGIALAKHNRHGSLSDKIKEVAGAASDLRMSGGDVAVMSSAGSGNHGIVAVIPVAMTARELGADDRKLAEALALSHLVCGYIKAYTGRLTPTCGCAVAAGAGAAAGIVRLHGGTPRQAELAAITLVGTLLGMICDGAKESCGLKVSNAASEAWSAAMLALENRGIRNTQGIISPDIHELGITLREFNEKIFSAADSVMIGLMTRQNRSAESRA